jgi:hypothetical protein
VTGGELPVDARETGGELPVDARDTGGELPDDVRVAGGTLGAAGEREPSGAVLCCVGGGDVLLVTVCGGVVVAAVRPLVGGTDALGERGDDTGSASASQAPHAASEYAIARITRRPSAR